MSDEITRPEFQVEDKVWWIPPGARFAVLATITSVRRMIPPGSIYFYEIDEPVGHDLSADQLCPAHLIDEVKEALRTCTTSSDDDNLKEWRKRRLKFIVSTRGQDIDNCAWPWTKPDYYPERNENEIIKV